jgi:hypothetical protein
MKVCGEKNDHDIYQLLLSSGQGNLIISASKFCLERYRELLVAAIIKHELLFSFVEYDDIRETKRYLRSDCRTRENN